MNTGPIAIAVGVRAVWLSFVLLTLPILLLAISLRSSEAAACAAGVNCYCDRVRGGDLKDTALLMCEDFEAPSLVSNSGVGNGPPYYGPWYDSTGMPGNRGQNGYFTKNYGNGVSGVGWSVNQPSSATFGSPCSFSQCMNGAWDATDRWQANSFAGLGIFRDSDFSVEVPSIAAPSNRSGGGSGAFDGSASLAHRIPPGRVQGIVGNKFWSAQTTFGITIATAYPTNLLSSGIVGAPWKHNQFQRSIGGQDALLTFFNGNAPPLESNFPFTGFIFHAGQAACESALGAATILRGRFLCNDVVLQWAATNYTQSVDWPLGTWACLRGFYQNMGSSNSHIQIFMTPTAGARAGVEQTIVDISNMNTLSMVPGGYNGFEFNNYANTNQGGGPIPSTQTSFRYEDNIHIRAGAPVSCSQIGFGSSIGPSTGPSTPAGVRLQ